MKILGLKGRIVLATNSRRTIEVEVETREGRTRTSVPIGTSRGKFEVKEADPQKALSTLRRIERSFKIRDFEDVEEIDDLLKAIDGTNDFSNIGGNLALAISSACLKAFALEDGKEVFEFLGAKKIPVPLCNVIGSWEKFKGFQEYLLYPIHQKSFFDSVERISKAYLQIGEILRQKDKDFNFGKNYESAWVTNLDVENILEILSDIAKSFSLRIGVDVAANSLFDGEFYVYGEEKLNKMEQLGFIEDLAKKFKISYIEDPFEENDLVSFSTLQAHLPDYLICGDDLYATNLARLGSGIDLKATRAAIIKPNQVGTITDAVKFFRRAKESGMKTVFSHRSGETDDSLICHLAVGLGSDFVKIGISGERIFKINEMIRIEEKLR